MWGVGRGLRNGVLALLGLLLAMLLVLVSLLIGRAYEWHRRYEPRPLPRDLEAVMDLEDRLIHLILDECLPQAVSV